MSSDCSFAGRKHVADFYSMFYFGEGIASGKHVAQTTDQPAQTGEKVEWKVKQNGGLSGSNESSVLSFDFVT